MNINCMNLNRTCVNMIALDLIKFEYSFLDSVRMIDIYKMK